MEWRIAILSMADGFPHISEYAKVRLNIDLIRRPQTKRIASEFGEIHMSTNILLVF